MMTISGKQLFFLITFSVLVFLLLLLGESALIFYIVGAIVLFFLSFYKKLDFKKSYLQKPLVLLWCFFIISIFLSIITSHSIPLSINSIVFFSSAFLFFWFFFLIKDSFLKRELIVINLVLITLVMGFFSSIFLVIPKWAEFLPGMNLLYATYGHNHLASVLLLIIPISWWVFWEYGIKNNRSYFILLPTFFTMSLLLSFGRVAIFLGLVQLLVIYCKFLRKKIGSKTRTIFFVLVATFIFLLIFKSFLSLSGLFSNNSTQCFSKELENKVCKSVALESRPRYWLQALSSFKEFPLLGYGSGTFSLINDRYKQVSYLNTNYAHNSFLQMFAESGVFAGILFLLLVCYPIWYLRHNLKDKALNFFLYVSILFISINALFDFDWSFYGVFSIYMIFLALLFKVSPENKIDLTNFKAKRMLKTFYFFVSTIIIVTMGMYLLTETLIDLNKHQLAFKIFPYFHNQKQIFLGSPFLTREDKDRFFSIYINHAPIVYNRISRQENEGDVLQLIRHLRKISPWTSYYSPLPESLILENLEFAREDLSFNYKLYEANADDERFDASYHLGQSRSQTAVKVGMAYLQKGDVDSAADMFMLAYKFNYWAFELTSEAPFSNLQTVLNKEEIDELLQGIDQIEPTIFGNNAEELAGLHRVLLREALVHKDLEKTRWHIRRAYNLTPGIFGSLESLEIKLIQQWADEEIGRGNFDIAEELLLLMGRYGSYWSKFQFANYFILMGNIDRAKFEYHQCLESWLAKTGEQHDDCQRGLELIDQNKTDQSLYYSTSAILAAQN